MSTNFYLVTKKKEKKRLFGSKAEPADDPKFGYQIHIAKTSCGWKPLFEAHKRIRSVADLKLLYDKGGIKIIDEYNTEYTWDEFVERVVNFGIEHIGNERCRRSHIPSYNREDYFLSVDGYEFTTHAFE